MEQEDQGCNPSRHNRKFASGGRTLRPTTGELSWRQNDGYQTGPEIGTKVPEFHLTRPTWQAQSWPGS